MQHPVSPFMLPMGRLFIYAAVGTVEFTPVKDGRRLHSVLLSNVLHVPELNQNLLSMLTLTVKHAFHVVIVSNQMEFIKDKITRFYALVGADLIALLVGAQSFSHKHSLAVQN